MSRLLAQMTEENVELGGRSARRAVQEAGFSDELTKSLEAKIAAANMAADDPGPPSDDTANAPSQNSAEGQKTVPRIPRTLAVHKKIFKATDPGMRLAYARDKSDVYASAQDSSVADDERARFRAEMKERFKPGSRQVAATLQGLAALADRRVEEAIARGAFKNILRGKKIERDHNANSPFIDTTEYFMNKMIQRQDIVPPWIEKQQEVTSTANKFRSGLRVAWKRHVARTIASWGGDLQSQMKLADEYAYAESFAATSKQAGSVEAVKQPPSLSTTEASGPSSDSSGGVETSLQEVETVDAPDRELTRQPTVDPFRDPQWERTERSYHKIAVANLNSLTRSYNLMAPDMAKKPYFSLERELRACYAAVAPQVAEAIKERALTSTARGKEQSSREPSGILANFSMDQTGRVYDEERPQYGFREFWRDLFSKDK
jgi:hypothetical protein